MRYWNAYTESGKELVTSIDISGKGKPIDGYDMYSFLASEFVKGREPSLYLVVSDRLQLRSEPDILTDPTTKKRALEAKKRDVEALVAVKQGELYEYNGHKYYPDERLMNAIATAYPFRPDDHTLDVKTAEKMTDGVNNVWVTLTKAELAGLSMGFLARQSDLWDYGYKTLKNRLNELYLDSTKTYKDIQEFDIESGWPS